MANNKRELVGEVGGAIASSVAGVLLGILIEKVFSEKGAPSFYVPLFQFIQQHVSEVLIQLAFFCLIVVIAIILYLLRSTQCRIYASLEIMIGSAIALYATNEIYGPAGVNPPIKSVFAAMAGIYVIIRGLDNWFHPRKA